MNVDQLQATLAQIGILVKHLNKKNYADSTEEINKLIEEFGIEPDRHCLRCLFSSINFSEFPPNPTAQLQAKFLGAQLEKQLFRAQVISNICFAIDQCFPYQKALKPSAQIISHIVKLTGINKLCECVLALALTNSSQADFRKIAHENLKRTFPELIDSYLGKSGAAAAVISSLHDVGVDLLHLLLSSLYEFVPEQLKREFLGKLREEFPRERVPLVLAPYLYCVNTNEDGGEREFPAITADGVDAVFTETAIEDICENICETLFTTQVNNNIMDTSWINLILEIGYEFTSNVEDCKNHLRCGSRELNSQDVAKIIGLMCRRHSSLLDCNVNLPTPGTFWTGQSGTQQQQNLANNNDPNSSNGDKTAVEKKDKGGNGSSAGSTTDASQTWKPDVFVQALKEVVPQLNWKEVCVELDHPEFMLKDRIGLDLLLTIFRLATQSSVIPHPEFIFRHWRNVEGQLVLISTMLKNPDLFCFADYIYHGTPLDMLKTPPDVDNKEIIAWKSLHLVELLLYIGEQGYYAQVHELFKFPVQNCPDVLFLSLLHLNPPATVIRQELFTQLIPTFLSNHPNSSVVLGCAWNSTNFGITIRPVIMHAMSEWYLRGGDYDQVRLSRILDVAHDLKALSTLLNARSFIFVIDLACLASRREYLKLEKWLSDKIREHGEPFIQAILKCLQRRCPQITTPKMSEEQMPPKQSQLPHETISTMVSSLQTCIANVPPEIADMILQMAANCAIIASKSRPAQVTTQVHVPQQSVVRSHRSIEMGNNAVQGVPPPNFSGNVNAQQMFGPGGIDTLSNLSTSVAGLNLSGPNGAFNFGNMLGNLVSTPASPSRLMNPAASPYPLNAMQMQPPPPNVSGLGRMQQAVAQSTPTPPNTNNPVMAELTGPVSKEVEDEANSYFQRIYNHPPHPTLSIDEVLDILQRFKESNIRREQEVYQCMLRNLFEEYRFFPHYPDKELQITAQLFGGIIERNLVPTFVALGLALRCVLDALRKSEGSKMYYFGITALDRFKTRLHTYNKYCEYIRSIPHFNDFPAHLVQYVECGYLSQEPPPPDKLRMIINAGGSSGQISADPIYRSNSVTGNIVTTPTQQKPMAVAQSIHASRMKSIATATNIDTLLVANQEEKVTVPPEPVQDKTAFIFNNLSQLNIPQKCDEIKEIMTKEYWPWLAQYLVVKRASMEFNFHSLYFNFLEALKNPDINIYVTKETLRNIKVLLRSDKDVINFSDRSLLKNLGHWLGMMTLGRNKPILQIDLDLKALLAEAYHKGQQELLFVVPFVAKILESTSKSKVFKTPNPWTMGIMHVLGELHQEPELKLNLKFEIEVLCKALSIDLSKLKPVIYLKDPSRSLVVEHQMSQPKPKALETSPQQQQQAQTQSQSQMSSNDADAQAMILGPNNNVPGGAVPSPSIGSESGGQVVMQAPEPRFSYAEVNVANYQLLAQQVVLSPSIAFLHANPTLKHVVLNAIERTITEWLQPVVDRSVRIAASTTEQIVRKDFALDADENRMRTAAYQMVRNLSAGMAMITCREQLTQTLSNNIRKAFLSGLGNSGGPNFADIETAAIQLTNDNVELACAFIQKTAAEKSTPEIDRRLAGDFESRKLARDEGSRFFDPQTLAYQSERMPEPVRLKVGVIPQNQFAVYAEFARNLPGFQPMTDRDITLFLPKPQEIPLSAFGNDELGLMYADLANKMEAFLNSTVNVGTLQLQASKMHALLSALMVTRRVRDNDSALTLLKAVVEGLIEGLINIPEHVEQMKLYRDIHLRILSLLQNTFGSPATERAITKCIFDIREEARYNVDAIKLLINSHFIHVQQFDLLLRDVMDNGSNFLAVTFAMSLMERMLVDERSSSMLAETEFIGTIEMLARLTQHRHRYPEALTHLIEVVWGGGSALEISSLSGMDRYLAGATQYIHSGMQHARSNESDDPPGLQEKTEFLLKDWVSIYSQSNTLSRETKNFGSFVQKMNLYGILKTDDLITRFFRQSTQFCIDLVYRIMTDPNTTPAQAKTKIFHWIDAFVHLIALLVRHSGEAGNPTTKINLLNKVLGIVLGILLQDQEVHSTSFQQLGYHRFFVMLFLELSSPDAVLETLMQSIVTAFSHTYHLLNPSLAPGFCYAWLELISHRIFIGRILAQIPQQKGWPLYAQLLLDLFKYLAPFLRNAELAKPVQLLYKGTLRVLLVLLHDFPEFLCDYHFGFCDAIPPNCIQMRNIILAAFPRNMRLPDPFTPNLKVDMLTETGTAPKICSNYVVNIQPPNFKKDLDSYLKARAPVTFLSELRSNLQISHEPGMRYNIPLMNALVLYVGTQAIAHISRSKNCVPTTSNIAHSAHMDIFQNLAVDSDTEGRYLFLNAIANQLRYPNSHTHYFSCAVLHLFAEANSEAIQEQITRVLLERLIVNRPHPWGLLITFIELIKNPIYKFWDHDFVHCAPEIAKLFESVARSCMVKSNHPQPINNLDGELSDMN